MEYFHCYLVAKLFLSLHCLFVIVYRVKRVEIFLYYWFERNMFLSLIYLFHNWHKGIQRLQIYIYYDIYVNLINFCFSFYGNLKVIFKTTFSTFQSLILRHYNICIQSCLLLNFGKCFFIKLRKLLPIFALMFAE